jgi:hypothetical protein
LAVICNEAGMTEFKLLRDSLAGRWHDVAVRDACYELDSGLSGADRVLQLCITGVPDHGLVELAIYRDLRRVLVVRSCLDACGRIAAAGDLVAAMYGRPDQASLRIPGSEFLGPGNDAPTRLHVMLRVAQQVDAGKIAVRLEGGASTMASAARRASGR